MANNYSLFSIRLNADPERAAEELKWLKDKTKRLEDGKAVFGYSGHAGWAVDCYDTAPNTIYLSSEITFDPEGLGILLMNYLKEFHDEQVLKVEWAETCSKPKPDEFGGGAMVVSLDGFEFFHTSQWALRKQAEWQELLTGVDLGLDDTISLEDDEEF